MVIKSVGKTATHNIIFHILDGSLFLSGMVFFEVSTILVLFVKQVYDNPVAVGFIPALTLFGYNLPGLVSTQMAKGFRIRKRFIMVSAFFQRCSLFLLVLSTFWVQQVSPPVAVTLVLLGYFFFCFCGGIGTPAWLDLLAKTLPVSHRARTFAIRTFIGSVAGMCLPLLISYLFSVFMFPVNYRYSFLMGFILIFLSYVAFMFVKEEKESPVPEKIPFPAYLKSLFKHLKNDSNLRNFLVTRLIFAVTTLGAAFYTSYAMDTIPGITAQTVVFYTLFLNSSKAGSSLVLGYLGDRFGNLIVLKINTVITTVTLIIAVFIPSYYTFFVIFIFLGVTLTANLNTGQVFITEFGDDKNRILYSTINIAITGSFSGLVPILGGLVLSLGLLQYKGLFLCAIVCGLLSIYFSMCVVKDPRHTVAGQSASVL
ncbi:MAG: MFS transporter [Spirochaetales bacterium]|nr:MFS transporter [Spirochaetales bacterium]